MRFFLGTHEPSWLRRLDVPLFVSHRRLARLRRELPAARAPWALDSGGFTEISMHGRWVTTADTYLAAMRRYADEIGRLEWAAPQDWMCEPAMIAKTGLSVAAHQERTVDSFIRLRDAAPDLPIIPVLQGWERDDYRRCWELYDRAGVDLEACATVGIGSVCRRQHEAEIGHIILSLAPLRLHGFGVKAAGLERYGTLLASADSMAWSYDARRSHPLPGCKHRRCNNCYRYALRWRENMLAPMSWEPMFPDERAD